MLEKGWNLKLPVDPLTKDLDDIHSITSSFKLLLDKTPEFKVGSLILVSTLNFENIEVQNKLEDLFSGPFIIKALHGANAVKLGLSGELENKHPAFPVSLVGHYTSSDK
ncbi:hypothetical protein O181_058366 [Austropuccinia psidii MF-1]|uniref:Uncharacterized protein n=1 Tax=Austropuccinia psidii MF-1 TaxID=1389203 RepID=A0A9Q3HUS6_9BASI|nr:hypothetical protein [Austropuccinia psidii MF-1]